ncbi:VWA domain-containing protein [Spartinivicinus poritis]|uniref:VWA domain-containing protein n=1 Tax=Spartinivicinus poritis TaxID=2994640 RepID=A0ABT5UC78_9GAMM|nr:VWA domain-containing protein [Spartinivicinus sp. A2-2]MDE1463986.1 VWA domain-containing protein [Spartinivicinus sp. A2-2]
MTISKMKPNKNKVYINYRLRYLVYSCLMLTIAMTLLASFQSGAEQTYFHPLLSLTQYTESKPIISDTNLLANQQSEQPLIAKEQLFIIDSSQLMSKPSLSTAKTLLIKALLQLTPNDRFNIIAVNSNFQQLFPNSKRANLLSVADAIAFVDTLSINGKGELLPALRVSAASPVPKDIGNSQIILLSSGQLGYQQLLEFTQRHIGKKQLFSFVIESQTHVILVKDVAHAKSRALQIISLGSNKTENTNIALQLLALPVAQSYSITPTSLTKEIKATTSLLSHSL